MKIKIAMISKIVSIVIPTSILVLVLSLIAIAIPRAVGAFDCGTAGCSPNTDLAFNTEDLDFILKQIKFAERHAAGEELIDILPNASIPWGLRTVDGSFNNLIEGQQEFGQADQEFPELVERYFSPAQPFNTVIPFSPDDQIGVLTHYNQGNGQTVQDSTPRLISHLIVNQSVDNPAAVYAANANEDSANVGADITGTDQLYIPNTAPDEGLSAPFNAFMTFFGQFFDHGLDLVNKGGNGVVFIPLQPDDPLYNAGTDGIPNTEDDAFLPNFMLITRATRDAGPDGKIGTADDVSDPVNATTPHVDQQQTYGSHSSAQILLRHYELRNINGIDVLQNTGRLLDGFGVDGQLDTADDGGMATWDTVQLQALKKFGITLADLDGDNMPLFLADLYGNFIPGSGPNKLPQLVTAIDENGIPTLVEGNLDAPVAASNALKVNHSFFLDVAHSANPNGEGGVGPQQAPVPDADTIINPRTDMLSGQTVRGIRASGIPIDVPLGSSIPTYDDELLGAHFACGDGRCNENIGLTTIHSIFHREHNRLTNITKRVLLDAGDLVTLNEWLDTPLENFPPWAGLSFNVSDASLHHQAEAEEAINDLNLDWNGQRIFQAGRFGTEMQYNRVVFDEFAPTLAGLKDAFGGFHTTVDPSIGLEFSQSVYRFGHSMLTNNVDRFDADFNPLLDDYSDSNAQLGLFEAFLNPLALYNSDKDGVAQLTPEQGFGSVVRGITRTRANEIDEFVSGALQNNLVGLPLDLGAINIARSRDVGNPRLNAARSKFYAATQDSRLLPYAHWADYADNLRYEPSLVNFIAAYGTHPSLAGVDGIVGNSDDPVQTFKGRRAAACAIVAELTTIGDLTPNRAAYCIDNGFADTDYATDLLPDVAPTPEDAMDFLFSNGIWASSGDGITTTGLDDVDFWNGGLAEERMPFGGFLGSTHNFVFENQIERLQNGDRFYYLGRTANIHLLAELESNSFTSLVMRNSDLGEAGSGTLATNIFSVPNHILEVDQSQQFNATGDGTSADPEGEAELTPLVIRNADQITTNIDVVDTTRVIQYTGGDHVSIGGTDGNDTIIAGIGDDSVIAGGGDDRIEGGDGNDHVEGGGGDDIITDLSGFDVIEGGAGNDAIASGNGEDVVFGDAGNDFIVNSSEFGELFGGEGDDYILDGIHNGHIRGGAGNDWMENLGGGEDLFQADNGAAPEAGEPEIKGHDVFIAHEGNNDADMENGNDIVVDGPGIDRVEGQLGFDWVSFENDRFGVDADLDLTAFLRPTLPPSNSTVSNRYDRVEGMSGSAFGDVLHGTSVVFGDEVGNELVDFDLIEGLQALVPLSERSVLPPDVVTGEAQFGWAKGEIILGGAGSDIMEGKGGDDIIDGDRSLKVRISTPDPAVRTGPEWLAFKAAQSVAISTESQAEADASAAMAFEQAGIDAYAALIAAKLAATSAMEAADAAAAAVESNMEIKSLIDGAIIGVGIDSSHQSALESYFNECSAIMYSLGLELKFTTADTAAEAIALQTQANIDLIASSQWELEATAATSANAATSAQAALATALAELPDRGPDGLPGTPDDDKILVAGMQDVMDAVFRGLINPGELSISRVISDDDLTGKADPNHDTDTAVFSGNRNQYTITRNGPNADPALRVPGFIVVRDDRPAPNDGRDLIVASSIERLQFANRTVLIGCPDGECNSLPEGDPTIMGVAEVPNELMASSVGVTDADNVSTAEAVDPASIAWTWLVEQAPGSGIFEPILRVGGLNGNGDAVMVTGETMTLTAEEANLRIQVTGRFQDEALVLETIRSAPVTVSPDPDALPPPPVTPGATLTINSVEWRNGKDRLRVRGDVAPVGTVTIFAPGVRDGTICTGTPVGTEVAAADGGFDFDTGNGGVVTDNPGSVCVQSDDLAVDART